MHLGRPNYVQKVGLDECRLIKDTYNKISSHEHIHETKLYF